MAVDQAPIEPTEALYLVALLPPSNVARAVGDVQAELFRRYRLVSALGLGVLLPLAFCQSPPPQPRRGPAGSALLLTQAGSMRTGGLVAARSVDPPGAGALYLEVGASGALAGEEGIGPERNAAWLAELRAAFPTEKGLFPLHTGLFLADLSELATRAAGSTPGPPATDAPPADGTPAAGLPGDLGALAPPAPLSWGTSELACLALRFARASSWWSFLCWETVWSVRLRRAPVRD